MAILPPVVDQDQPPNPHSKLFLERGYAPACRIAIEAHGVRESDCGTEHAAISKDSSTWSAADVQNDGHHSRDTWRQEQLRVKRFICLVPDIPIIQRPSRRDIGDAMVIDQGIRV